MAKRKDLTPDNKGFINSNSCKCKNPKPSKIKLSDFEGLKCDNCFQIIKYKKIK